MDKYEYKLKLDEIETLTGEKKYAAAAEVADRDSSKERRKEQMDLLHLQKPSGAIQRDRRTNSWK